MCPRRRHNGHGTGCQGRGQACRLLVLSGKEDHVSADAARSLGASDYLPKGTTALADIMKRVHHFAALAAQPGG